MSRSIRILGGTFGALLGSGAYFAYHTAATRRELSSFLPVTEHSPGTFSNMTVNNKFETLFAVPLHCEGCVKDVSDSLNKLDGISNIEANLKDQLIRIEGTVPPSAIVAAIEATGRDAILRGSGGSNSAAVSILETFGEDTTIQELTPTANDKISGNLPREVRGLARMVEVSPNVTLVDLTIRGVAPGTYYATIREYGDLKDGAASAGPVWKGHQTAQIEGLKTQVRGQLGTFEVGADGRGAVFLDRPFQVWEVIGHAFVVTRQEEEGKTQEEGGKPAVLQNDENTVVGVIARSAGMWDNDKTVCSCTGKTLWEERKDEVKKGML
ncbi:superoxide dismutase [Coniella lustricola]|uniref:Superoxide dismutase 1 copper chaperone n=1 Tax=Coniella lustricola TaxID=2025994 RepID=A0A2T2ZZ10_9PEZI|nr:superoxide dismutase [Coniella lustricola]